MAVKVLDAGGKLMLSGIFRAEVEVCLSDYTNRGAKVIAPVQRIGPRWTAACTLPANLTDADTTTSLSFSELAEGAAKSARTASQFADGCTVQELGFKQVISGPSRHAVRARIDHLKQFGAAVLSDIEPLGEHWTAVVDIGGVDKAYRW